MTNEITFNNQTEGVKNADSELNQKNSFYNFNNPNSHNPLTGLLSQNNSKSEKP